MQTTKIFLTTCNVEKSKRVTLFREFDIVAAQVLKTPFRGSGVGSALRKAKGCPARKKVLITGLRSSSLVFGYATKASSDSHFFF